MIDTTHAQAAQAVEIDVAVGQPFAPLASALRADGYWTCAPTSGAATIDAQVCRDSACSACGRRGLEFRPFWRPVPRSYRAFALCPVCGAWEEF